MVNYNLKNLLIELFKEAKNGKEIVYCDKLFPEDNSFFTYYSKFYVSISSGLPKEILDEIQTENSKYNHSTYATIVIPDFDSFVKTVEDYLAEAREFYKEDIEYLGMTTVPDQFDKKLILDLLKNVNISDCHNIYNYIQTRTKFLKTKVETDRKLIGEFDGLKIYNQVYANTKVHSSLEGPYTSKYYIVNQEGCVYDLPKVLFGDDGENVYLFAIQREKKKQLSDLSDKQICQAKLDEKLDKKLDRYFRKVNKNVDLGSEIAKVPPTALVSLTLFCSELLGKNKTNVIFPGFMPIRYQATRNSVLKKAQTKEQARELIQKHDENQYNMTNRFNLLLERFCHHFKDSELEFDDVLLNTYLKLRTQKERTDSHILYELTDCINHKNNFKNEKEPFSL